ncbi:serine protease snake-like [Diprion similis]|uniref:serine protease snake-like n=1 Tax=Diprion similis TaxID=362088 RepID=UPI001EF7E9B5|nr:serine protease snake-like [Diprion similis]
MEGRDYTPVGRSRSIYRRIIKAFLAFGAGFQAQDYDANRLTGNLFDDEPGAIARQKLIDRPVLLGYKLPSVFHDIALLPLESRVSFNAWIHPLTTRTPRAIATEWSHGNWDEDEGSNDVLKLILPFFDEATCKASYSSWTFNTKLPNGVVGELTICGGKGGSDACQSNSGGSLIIYSKKKYCMNEVVGFISLARSYGLSKPGTYTRVYHYVPWIETIVWG